MSKKRYAKLDEMSKVRFAVFDSDEEALENGFLPYKETDKPMSDENIIPHNYCRDYKEVNGEIILSWKAYPNYEAIEKLKKLLATSDYKITKCYEASLLGNELPYDITNLHTERQEIRNEINRLEACE